MTASMTNTLLATAPIGPLIDRLFAEADAARPQDAPELQHLLGQHQQMMRSKTEYATFYGVLKDFPLAVSRETGHLLYMLARSLKARTIVEFGTSFGISTLHMAAALRENGGGRLITSEFEPSKAARARENLAAGGVADLVEIREGDALKTLAKDLPDAIDLVLLDGAKALYPEILALVEQHLRAGAVIIADNADDSPDYLSYVRDPENGYLSLPFELGGIIGSIGVGWLSDRFFRTRRLWLTSPLLLLLGGALLLYQRVGGAGVVINVALLALVGFLLFGPDSLLSGTTAQDLGGRHATARVAGIINGMGSVGAIFSPMLVARITERLGWDALFLGFCGLTGLSSLLLAVSATLVPAARRALASPGPS